MASVAKREWTHKGETKTAWVVRYTDQGGKRRMKTFEKKKDADRYRNKVETELGTGTHVADSSTLTVRSICDAYLKYCEDRVRAGECGTGWLIGIKSTVDRNIIPSFGAKLITSLTFLDVDTWHGKLLLKVKPKTAREKLKVLAAIERFAARRGYLAKPVARLVLEDAAVSRVTPIRTFKIDEARNLLNLVNVRATRQSKRGNLFLRCAVELAALCGLRLGEILGLTVESVDFDAMCIKVRHNMTPRDEHKSPKTASGLRDVPMPERLAASLRAWMAAFYIPNPRRVLFRTKTGRLMSRVEFHRYWHSLLERAGLAKAGDQFHFHALRHFAASLMIEVGLPLTDVASLMGHKRFDMTLQVYAHPIVGGNRRRDAFEHMATALAS